MTTRTPGLTEYHSERRVPKRSEVSIGEKAWLQIQGMKIYRHLINDDNISKID